MTVLYRVSYGHPLIRKQSKTTIKCIYLARTTHSCHRWNNERNKGVSFNLNRPFLSEFNLAMTKKTKTRRFAVRAKVLSTKDNRITENKKKAEEAAKAKQEALVRHVEQISSAMFFKYV